MIDWLLWLFLGIVCIHLVYICILYRAVASIKIEKEGKYASVSVIIAARNEAENLNQLIASIFNQNHTNFEVILVNDRSEDNSESIIKDLESKHNGLSVIHVKEKPEAWNGKKYALKLGIEKAKNEVLLFTDADCVPKSETWILDMTGVIDSSTEVILGYSPYQQESGFLNEFIQFETLLTGIQYLGLAQMGQPYMGVGRNLAILRSSYDLDFLTSIANLTGGDDDLIVQKIANQKNTKTVIHYSSQTKSKAERKFKSYYQQKVRHLGAGKYYRQKYKTLLAIFTLSYVVSWVLFGISAIVQPTFWIFLIYGIRCLAFYIIFSQLGRKLSTKLSVWALPLVDLCFPFYYLLIGLRALLPKSIEWKQENSFLKKH